MQFFSDPTADPTGYGQGETYLGQTTVTTDSNGNASFQVDFPTVIPARTGFLAVGILRNIIPAPRMDDQRAGNGLVGDRMTANGHRGVGGDRFRLERLEFMTVRLTRFSVGFAFGWLCAIGCRQRQ